MGTACRGKRTGWPGRKGACQRGEWGVRLRVETGDVSTGCGPRREVWPTEWGMEGCVAGMVAFQGQDCQ